MKKTNQTDLDFEMINLDETAGWNKLEIDAALYEKEKKKESVVFQGEVTISEEELFSAEEMLDYGSREGFSYDGDEALYEVPSVEATDTYDREKAFDVAASQNAFAKEKVYFGEDDYDDEDDYDEDDYDEDDDDEDDEYDDDDYDDEDDSVLYEDEYLDEDSLTRARVSNFKTGAGKKSRRRQPRTPWEKIQAKFQDMTALDGIVAAVGVLVLVVAIVTVSIFSGAKAAEKQVEAFASIGEDMEYLTDGGKGTLVAMADAKKLVQSEEPETETEEEEETFEYEEKELDTSTVNVNMKMTSVQKDLKIKFVNQKTGKLVSNVKFKVSIEGADKKTKEYTDDDMDGIIYLTDMKPGKVTVTMLAISGEEDIAFNTVPQTITVKDKIEYTKIDVAEEVKSENEVNAAIEDTAKENVVEATLTDTVEWVASSKKEAEVKESYQEVKKDTIADPAKSAKITFMRMTETTTTTTEAPNPSTDGSQTPSESSSESSSEPSSEPTSTPESSSPDSSSPESSSPESSTPESSTPENSTTETTTPESSTTGTTTPETSTQDKNSPKNDTVSLLKDKSGNQLYLKKSDGKYVEAKYADYYNDKAVFYKKIKSSSYIYTGWQNIDGKTYFYDKNGKVVTGEQVIQGAKYNFSSDGALVTGSGTLGIDVSKWNGSIDWNAVKASGVSYVIIRCGYRGSTTGAMIEDPKFKTNIKGASAAGLKVGIYFFSQAINEVEAVEEASMTINLIKNYAITYPVFLDVESSGGRGDNIDKNTRTKVIKAYCETIKNSGYKAGVYANKTWLNSYMNVGELGSYKIWLAQYNTKPTYSGKYDMWQYSSKGSVSGISGYTDMNLSYLGY